MASPIDRLAPYTMFGTTTDDARLTLWVWWLSRQQPAATAVADRLARP